MPEPKKKPFTGCPESCSIFPNCANTLPCFIDGCLKKIEAREQREQSDYQEARERIIDYIKRCRFHSGYDFAEEIDTETIENVVRDILHLTYSDGSPMIGVLARNQTAPDNKMLYSFEHKGYEMAVEGLRAAGFHRIAKEE